MRHTSTLSTRGLTVLAVGLSALGCGDATGVDPDDLVGTWRASSAIATNAAAPSQTVDLVASGFSITFIIEADGRVDIVFQFQDITDTDVGFLTVTDGEFRLVIDGITSTGTISRRDDTLTIDIITGVEWEFGEGGFDVPATLLLTMQRST